MAKLDGKSTDNPKLMQKELKNGTYSLYLEYYLGYTKTINEESGKEVTRKNRRKESFESVYIESTPKSRR